MTRPKPVLLLILDGWGYREDAPDNAISCAKAPHWRQLIATQPHTLIHTSGLHVGLPDGQMGNSEVGHMNLGAGRVVYQELTRIDKAISDGDFFDNAELVSACDAVIANGATLHVMGLLSPGGVHSHESHILAMLDLAQRRGVGKIAVHAFLDGRDTPPRSAADSLQRLQSHCDGIRGARIRTLSGRYYAMDRDQRWDRVSLAWNTLVHAASDLRAGSAEEALEAAYARGENDEFVLPTVLSAAQPMADGDAVVFMNFRADRARQLTACFVKSDFAGFDRGAMPKLSRFVCLTEYSADLPAPVAFTSTSLRNTLPEVIAAANMTQLRIAETEKYAHVTFFFSGGVEAPQTGEDRILVPSPKVATYDLQPEMSCPELTAKLVDDIRARRHDVIICNIANPDMVGHTGILSAAVAAVEAVDTAIGEITRAIADVGGEMLLTADHGNLEQMSDHESGQPHTSHTTGPVPLVYVGRPARLRAIGALQDVAPTLLALLGLRAPAEMTGRSLVEFV